VFFALCVFAFAVMFGSGAMKFGGILVMFSRLIVFIFGHWMGTKPVIPNRSNRKQLFSFSKRLYKLRWRIEAAFNRLKDFRRIATRYDRLARNYLASVCLAAALVWWI
jgi:hypothetical protein